MEELTGISKQYLAEVIFDLSVKTLDRHKKEGKKLSTLNGEVALKLLNLYNKGIEIFGSVDTFSAWVNKPSFGLGNQIPFKLLNTITGLDLIREELLRIEFGALA